ncbi:unnamed protein product [Rotaria socialis]|uniref:Uncharacterized protein n=1 Tax=Rotaria socialis TaxID=392032 RepID=A0A817XCT8_9BILA|nr:unnamed protein product [Rotaria socialis]
MNKHDNQMSIKNQLFYFLLTTSQLPSYNKKILIVCMFILHKLNSSTNFLLWIMFMIASNSNDRYAYSGCLCESIIK